MEKMIGIIFAIITFIGLMALFIYNGGRIWPKKTDK